jgi:hypothetical protein
MSILFDAVFVALIVAAFIVGSKKGFVKSIWKIAALVITIVLVMLLKTPATNLLMNSDFAVKLSTRISETIEIPSGGGVNIAENLNLPQNIQPQINDTLNNAQDTAAISVGVAATDVLTGVIITAVACVSLFIVIRLILMAAYMIINGVTKLPIISGANKIAGGLLGAVNMIFIVYILLTIMMIYINADSALPEIINKTYIVKYLYNYNILLKLFMKV